MTVLGPVAQKNGRIRELGVLKGPHQMGGWLLGSSRPMPTPLAQGHHSGPLGRTDELRPPFRRGSGSFPVPLFMLQNDQRGAHRRRGHLSRNTGHASEGPAAVHTRTSFSTPVGPAPEDSTTRPGVSFRESILTFLSTLKLTSSGPMNGSRSEWNLRAPTGNW